MRSQGFAAVLLGALFLVPVAPARGQAPNLAYAIDPRPDYVVFLDKGTDQLSSAAADTVRIAARAAARSGKVVRLVGRSATASPLGRSSSVPQRPDRSRRWPAAYRTR